MFCGARTVKTLVDRMKKVVFIVGNDYIEAPIIFQLYQQLSKSAGYEVMAITLEHHYGDTCRRAILMLQQMGVPYKDLNDFNVQGLLRVVETIAADIIVLHNDSAIIARIFIECARHLGIPTLLVQVAGEGPRLMTAQKLLRLPPFLDVSFLAKDYGLLWRTLTEVNRNPLISVAFMAKHVWSALFYWSTWGCNGCDRIAVFGDYYRRNLLGQHIPQERIVVTGNPRLDAVHHINQGEAKERVSHSLSLSPDKKLVLLLTQANVEDAIWSAGQQKHFISEVLNSVRPDYAAVLKLHPRESLAAHRELLDELSLGDVALVQNEIPLYDLLAACDVATGAWSTTLLEAMAFDKPVIVANLFQAPDYVGYVASGAAIGVERGEDLASAIHSALYNEEVRARLAENRKKFLYDYAYVQDGQASKRVADLITGMIKNSRKARGEA